MITLLLQNLLEKLDCLSIMVTLAKHLVIVMIKLSEGEVYDERSIVNLLSHLKILQCILIVANGLVDIAKVNLRPQMLIVDGQTHLETLNGFLVLLLKLLALTQVEVDA